MRVDAEAAEAEAAVFTLMRLLHLDPFPAEDPSTGGADFLCTATEPGNSVVVEVTIVRAESVAAKSGLPAQMGMNTGARWFRQITELLRTKATAKTAQLKNQTKVRVR